MTSTVQADPKKSRVNDFTINVATTNGTGSQTSNIALLRAMFRMGIAVTGKSLFPSNIQGMPTRYKLRVNNKGYQGYRDKYEVLITTNPTTCFEDIANVEPGGAVFYDTSLKLLSKREDISYYEMPVKQLVKEMEVPSSLRTYIANMVYVGVVAQLLSIPMDKIRGALDTHFSGKEKAVALNMKMVQLSADWARDNLQKTDEFSVEAIEGGNKDLILAEGNYSAALGAVYGGASVVGWYPITPATSVVDGLNKYLPELRKDKETGKNTFAVIQTEDELAAIGVILGAGWAGARSVTSTSGPGISLMAEFAGLGYIAEIPAVIWDVQRVGPSTGLPTRTSQGDIFFTYFLGHGDGKQVLLFPHSPAECFEFGHVSFDVAEQLQTPVFVLSDLDIGMNLWMSEKYEYPSEPMKRGKVLTAEQLEELGTKWGRFVDFDGDGIPYRTIPGTDHPRAGYFTRGTGHNTMASYSERADDWVQNLERLRLKFETARTILPEPKIHVQKNASIGIISLGTNHSTILESIDIVGEKGVSCDYMRIRALPLHPMVEEFIHNHEQVYVVENNFDGQLHKIMQMDYPKSSLKLHSVARCNGLPLDADWLVEELEKRFTTKPSA